MPRKIEMWECSWCEKVHNDEQDAIACEASHYKVDLNVRYADETDYPKNVMISLIYPLKKVNAVYELKFIESTETTSPIEVYDELSIFDASPQRIYRVFDIPLDERKETAILYAESGIREEKEEDYVETVGYAFGLFESRGLYYTLYFTFPYPTRRDPSYYAEYDPIDTTLEGELEAIKDGESLSKHPEVYRKVLERLLNRVYHMAE